MADKVFRTFNQQLLDLRKKGLDVPTDGSPKRVLEKENYYNVINGYKDLFLDTGNPSGMQETFKANTHFNELNALYEFDFELKNLILKRILRVENNIKTQVAYVFSKYYGHDNYLKMENFNYIAGNKNSIKDISKLINTIQGNIANQIDKHDAIKHYMLTYGYVPLWVLINVLTLGNISRFYSLMKQPNKQEIAKFFNVSDAELDNILKNITLCRNKCAHGEILYNFKSSAEIRENRIHRGLSISKTNGKLDYGTRDLFSIIVALKLLLPKKEFNKMVNEINHALSSLKKSLKVINIEEILSEMGFPSNWKDIIQI